MAIKSSNQITFTEHKKIVEIKEWYLATSVDTGVTTSTAGWTTNIQTIDYTNKYLWNYEEVIYSIGSSDISEPIIIGTYGERGSSLQVKYISSSKMPTIINNDVSGWSNTIPIAADGQKIYMTQKLSSDINWSVPIQISAIDGTTPVVTIIDGYWCVNGEYTGVKAEGTDGYTPEVTIGKNGNWFINGVDSGTKAQGEAGKDGTDIEYVYYRSKDSVELSAPSYTNGVLTSGWTASPQGITEAYKYEYVSIRNKPSGEGWSNFSAPVVWSKWGEKGQDGDGIEYKYYLSNSNITPTYSTGNSKWTDDPQGVSVDQQYEYVVQIKTSNGSSSVSSPSLWAKFGEDGVGINTIKNYYLATSEPVFPDAPKWVESVPMLSPTNKYLWNYEVITYTEGEPTKTEPAIIGVYGDSGTDATAVEFQIYSVNGFMFKEELNSIELKIAAFAGGNAITDATYTWEWWNDETNSYSSIVENTTDQSFVVNELDQYALAGLKCTMYYNGKTYEDYVILTNEVVIYTSVVKLPNGRNILRAEDLYIIAYVDLYQNNRIIESPMTSVDGYHPNLVTVDDSGVISTDLIDSFSNGDKKYFVQKIDDMYDVVLGTYRSGVWYKTEKTTIHQYYNSLYTNVNSNILAISKEHVNKSSNITFTIWNSSEPISEAYVNIVDSNDPIISDTEPQKPVLNQLWLNTLANPPVLKICAKINDDGTAVWMDCSKRIGGNIHTSKPNVYSNGDLWILANGERCTNSVGTFEAGSMLKAVNDSTGVFVAEHWVDADAAMTELKNNVKQYFRFNATNGLIIGQNDNAFHVNITSQQMTFNHGNNPVVHIGYNSANIDNLTADGNFVIDEGDVVIKKTTNNNAKYSFKWQIEKSNGSFSLVKM